MSYSTPLATTPPACSMPHLVAPYERTRAAGWPLWSSSPFHMWHSASMWVVVPCRLTSRASSTTAG
ncbi:hypothetical protein [Nonomuraea fastidiosa]|jgi:hypothetical protein